VAQVIDEPVARQLGDLFERARFLEKVRRARDHHEFALLVSASSIRCNIPLGPVPAPAGVLACLRGGNRIALTVDFARTMKSFKPNQIVLMHADLPTITPDEPGLAVQQTNDLATRDFRPYSAPVR
jgi:hypothetical protein